MIINENEAKRILNKYMVGPTYQKGIPLHCEDLKKGILGFPLIQYGIITTSRIQRILAIGSAWGYVPRILAEAAQQTDGRVDFVDASYHYKKDGHWLAWGGTDNWSKFANDYKAMKEYFDGMPIDLHVHTIENYCLLRPNDTYQYIYVDGNHSYEGTKSACDLTYPMLECGGFMVMHDTNVQHINDARCQGPRHVAEEMRGKFKSCLEFGEAPGLTIFRKE